MSVADNAINKDDPLYPHQFQWFQGVIEDNLDPEQRGRYRVRCFGYHTERKDYIPTTALPWAHAMMPITSASQCGVGESATGLLRGSWVIGFFRDGQTAQDPVIMGSIPALTSTVDYDFGFCDPVEQYPYKDKIGDQDTPEEAISKDGVYKESFTYEKKEEHRKNTPEVPIALDGGWKLPPVDTIVQPEYPKNHVRAYERKLKVEDVKDELIDSTGILDKDADQVEFFEGDEGADPKKEMHTQEFDVTPDWERVSTMHSTGTYHEWTPLGDETVVIVGKEYRIIIEDQHVNVQGDCTLTVDGDYHRLVKGDEFIEVHGNRTEVIAGSVTQTVGAFRNELVGASKTVNVLGNVAKTIAGSKFENTAVFRSTITGGSRLDTTGGVQSELVTGLKAAVVGGVNHNTVIGAWNNIAYGFKSDIAFASRLESTPIVATHLAGAMFVTAASGYTRNSVFDLVATGVSTTTGVSIIETAVEDITYTAGQTIDLQPLSTGDVTIKGITQLDD